MGNWFSGKWPTKAELNDYNAKIGALYDCPCGSMAQFRCTTSMYIISCPSCGRESCSDWDFKGTPDQAIEKWRTDAPLTRDEQRYLVLRSESDKCRAEKPMPKEMYMAFVDSIWKSDMTTEEKAQNWESLYIDQATKTTYAYDRKIFSAYTPYGVKEIESWFIKRIQEVGTEKQWVKTKELEKLLMSCRHLHIVFRSDLYSNLENYKKAEKSRMKIRKRQYESSDGPNNYILERGAWKRKRTMIEKD